MSTSTDKSQLRRMYAARVSAFDIDLPLASLTDLQRRRTAAAATGQAEPPERLFACYDDGPVFALRYVLGLDDFDDPVWTRTERRWERGLVHDERLDRERWRQDPATGDTQIGWALAAINPALGRAFLTLWDTGYDLSPETAELFEEESDRDMTWDQLPADLTAIAERALRRAPDEAYTDGVSWIRPWVNLEAVRASGEAVPRVELLQMIGAAVAAADMRAPASPRDLDQRWSKEFYGDEVRWTRYLRRAWDIVNGRRPSAPFPSWLNIPRVSDGQYSADNIRWEDKAYGVFEAYMHLLRYRLGWNDIYAGLAAWNDQGRPVHDPVFAFMARLDGDGLDWFIEVAGGEGLHLAGHLGAPLRRESFFVDEPNELGEGDVCAYRYRGWYSGLSRFLDGNPDGEVEVVVEPIGILGTYRRSPTSGVPHATTEEIHLLGRGRQDAPYVHL